MSEALVGSKAVRVNDYKITGPNASTAPPSSARSWTRTRGARRLHRLDRKGEPLSELKWSESTASAIMGREAYTGKVVTFDDVVNSTTVLAPSSIDLSAALPTPPVPMPGATTN